MPMYSIGSLISTATGFYAGETAVEACQKGDYSAKTLSKYADRVLDSFVMDDLKKYNRTPYYSDNYPDFFRIMPETAINMAERYLSHEDTPARSRQLYVFRKAKEELTLFPFARELFEAKRRFGDYY